MRYKYIIALIIFCVPLRSNAYSVLTHEAIIDAMWERSIEPLLKHKYPGATEVQLKEAHAYAYGGAVAPDMGYFPFGSRLFTNLVHYVRGGDFVDALLAEAQNMDEYAFALGALSHYNADHYGHPLGVNISVPLLYPKDRLKYGDTVTYEEDKTAHLRMEFGFDVLQTARGNYVAQSYHDFIGFEVSEPVLERAFVKTYGLDLHDLFGDFSVAVGTFRWSVKDLFPSVTKVAWSLKKNEIMENSPMTTSKSFIYRANRHAYVQEFGKERIKPGFSASVIAFIIRVFPKIGPLKGLNFKPPTPQAEKNFIQSFDTVLIHYAAYSERLDKQTTVNASLNLPNIDYDTGNKTSPGEYSLADANYGTLLLMLKEDDFRKVTPELKQNILLFYSQFDSTRTDTKVLKALAAALKQLKSYQPSDVMR